MCNNKINYISPSLLNSWLSMVNTENADSQDFINYLHRVEKPQTEALCYIKQGESGCDGVALPVGIVVLSLSEGRKQEGAGVAFQQVLPPAI